MKKLFLSLSIVASWLAVSCVEESNSSSEELSSPKISIRLTDAPASYDEVLIDLQEVRVHFSGEGEEEGGWHTLENVNTGIYNLLDFTNGADTLIAEEEFTVGKISQIRLILGENNKIKKDGVYHDIKTPSAQQSGLKLNVHAELEMGVAYRVWLDFDASRSIVAKGNGTYSLKPVIRVFTEAASGALKGMVFPVESKPYIQAISANADTFSTYADTTTGYFMIKALPEGNYKVDFNPVEGYQIKEIDEVELVNGEINDMGTVTIEEAVTAG
ncbi:DUF4382 domain-containing protein [Saccharicrinis sp. GN24d3]|uniref:DUF4382 domain-containing protein n=1 Tax=Saccharicrinis sp. GN24d3 TaxID=3458416 RepID=UPI00403709EA